MGMNVRTAAGREAPACCNLERCGRRGIGALITCQAEKEEDGQGELARQCAEYFGPMLETGVGITGLRGNRARIRETDRMGGVPCGKPLRPRLTRRGS